MLPVLPLVQGKNANKKEVIQETYKFRMTLNSELNLRWQHIPKLIVLELNTRKVITE